MGSMYSFNNVQFGFLGHSGILIKTAEGKRIAIDPYNVAPSVEKVDFILITHSHYDHCSIKDIEHLSKKGTTIVVPADAQSKIVKVEGINMQVAEVGDEFPLNGSLKISVVPAYNVDKEFHPKSEGWFGYIVRIGEVVVYHAGDSDVIPEMDKLTGFGKKGNFLAVFLPVSGVYVMSPEEAAEVANRLNPSLAVPIHYGAGVAGTDEDAKRFVEICKGFGVNAVLLEKLG